MRRGWALFALTLAASAHNAAGAQAQPADQPIPQPAEAPTDAATPADGEDIVVTGMSSGGFRLSADQLRDAVRTFAHNRAEFAPRAVLRWRIVPREGANGLEVRLVNDRERLVIPVDASGEFTLPEAPILRGGWRLQTNAGRRQIRIRPVTFSPGSDDSDFRMGDARLLCRVFWSFSNNQQGVFMRGLFSMVGGCGSSRVAIYYRSERPVATAMAGTIAFDVRPDGLAYRPLLHDRALTNDTRVRITYR